MKWRRGGGLKIWAFFLGGFFRIGENKNLGKFSGDFAGVSSAEPPRVGGAVT